MTPVCRRDLWISITYAPLSLARASKGERGVSSPTVMFMRPPLRFVSLLRWLLHSKHAATMLPGIVMPP